MKFWIARDKDGCLCLHEEKPFCGVSGTWYSPKQMMHLSKDLFLEVTWENSPQEVEIKLIDNESEDVDSKR